MIQMPNGLTEEARSCLRTVLNLTRCRKLDPEHALIVMLEDADSPVVQACRALRPQFKASTLREALSRRISSDAPGRTVLEWSDDLLSESFGEMLDCMQQDDAWADADDRFQERLFAAAVVGRLRAGVNTLRSMGLETEALEVRLRQPLVQREAHVAVFDERGDVNFAAFDRSAQDVLRLMEAEGQGLGLPRVVSSLMLFAFLSHENGVLQTGLRLQVPKVDPKRFRESLAAHIRSLGNGRFNEGLKLHVDQMQPVVAETLKAASREADALDRALIGEAEMLKAFLLADDVFANTALRNEKVDLKHLSSFVAQYQSGETLEAPDEPEPELSIAEIEERLRQRIIGQDHAIDVVMPLIKRLRFGYLRKGRPAGVLLFLGFSGTGKTQLAREIARTVYGSEDQLIFLEMGQFGSEHSKTSFVGAPPGLVGYGEGILTNGLRDKPESVVLFDEVEKAHKSVFDVVLRFLDEGMISDASGAIRDGTRCIIILTSNLGVRELESLIERQTALQERGPAQLAEIRAEIRRTLMTIDFFRPEFINRVDELVLFNGITRTTCASIVDNLLEQERERFLKEKELSIQFGTGVREILIERSLERSSEGARVCLRMVSDFVVTPLIDFFLDERNASCRSATLGVEGSDRIVVTGG